MNKIKNIQASKCFRPFGNESGSILVMVLGLSLCILIVFSSLQSQSLTSLKRFKVYRTKKIDLQELKAESNMVLGTNLGCSANFKGLTIRPGQSLAVSTLYYNDQLGMKANPMLVAGEPNPTQFWRSEITGISLIPDPTNFGPAGSGNHLTELVFKRNQETILELPIYVSTDSAGQILGCHSTQFVNSTGTACPLTVERRFCTDPMTTVLTTNWPQDCYTCAEGSTVSYSNCMWCKSIGKTYDSTTQTCL